MDTDTKTPALEGELHGDESKKIKVVHSPELKDEPEPAIHFHNDLDQPAINIATDIIGTLNHDDLGGVSANQHHAQLHASSHSSGGGDDISGQTYSAFTINSGTLISPVIGTPTVTGGTATNLRLVTPTIGTMNATGGTATNLTAVTPTIGTMAATGGTATNLTLVTPTIGTPTVTGGTADYDRLLVPMGEISYFNMSGTAVVIASQSDGTTNMVKAVAATTLYDPCSCFDNGGADDGRLRYTEAISRVFHIACTISVAPAGANDTFVFGVAQNGTVSASSKVLLQAINASQPRSTAMHVAMTLAQNDYLELYVGNTTDADDCTLHSLNIFAMGM